MHGTHYPQILAQNELSNRELVKTEQSNKKTLTSFCRCYPYLFDGLTFLLSNPKHINGKHRNYLNPNAPKVDVVERKDDDSELFYKTMMPIDTFYQMCLGTDNLDQCRDLLQQIMKFVDEPGLKKIFYHQDDGQTVVDLTQPIRISFQHITGRNLTRNELQYQKNFAKNGTESRANASNPIAFVTIEYHKGLFKDLLHQNTNGTIGWKYFRTAPHFQANLIATIKQLLESDYFNTYKDGKLSVVNAPLMPHDARELYFFLLERNNDTADAIRFTTLELCHRCEGFGRYINRHTLKDGTVVESVPTSRGFELRAKIEKIIVTMKQMALHGNMDGSILLPYELDENRVMFDATRDIIQIKILHPDKMLRYDLNQIPQL